jgi:hypothetical protein
VQKVREAAARTQSINNIKQLVLASHGYNDVCKMLPFNGLEAWANKNNHRSGSWGYQILPFLEKQMIYDMMTGTAPPSWTYGGVPVMLCAARGRAPAALTGTYIGPFTDFSINCWINDPVGGNEEAVDSKRSLQTIPDGTSNTILYGQRYIRTGSYQNTVGDNETFSPIIWGGDNGTGIQANDGSSTAQFKRDEPGVLGPNEEIWGSSFSQGALFGVADGTVRMIPYGVKLSPYLRPNDGSSVAFPD